MSLTAKGFKSRNRRCPATVLLASLLLIAAAWYSSAELESTPVNASTSISQNPAVSGSLIGDSTVVAGDNSRSPGAAAAAFAPFLDIVPSQDGTELFISAGGVGELGGMVFANVGIGPGGDKHSWTMIYSDTTQVYVVTVPGFSPTGDQEGALSITTTLGLDTGETNYVRAHIPFSSTSEIKFQDSQLNLIYTDTLPTEAYIAVVRSYAPSGPLPLGHQLAGNAFRNAYSVRASGALVVSDRPMSLRLDYGEINLAGADPHTLAIFAWDAHYERWDNLGGTPFFTQRYLSVATSRFTTYALLATPAWHDDFWDFDGLNYPAEGSNITLRPEGDDNRVLVLFNTSNPPSSGTAVSKPITPTTEFAAWGSLTFTRTVDPPTTTLTVDVLSLDGTALLTDVTSGVSLAALAPAQYPALKLRANLSSTVAGETPALDVWRLAWEVEEHKVYVPVMLR